MRHLWSLLAGVVAAPLAWLCLATGQHRSSRTVATWNEENFFDTAELIGPAAILVAAGILLGLVGTLRWSPLGPLVAGLLFVVPTVFMFINPFRTLDAFSFDQQRRVFEQDLQPWLPVENGTLLVLGSLLLMAVFSAQRWRRWPTAPAALPATADHEVAAGTTSVSERPPPGPMSDEEILAAAAAMEEEERATTTGERATATGERTAATEAEEAPAATADEPRAGTAEPPTPSESTTPPESAESPKPKPDPDNQESSTRSGSSTS